MISNLSLRDRQFGFRKGLWVHLQTYVRDWDWKYVLDIFNVFRKVRLIILIKTLYMPNWESKLFRN